MAIAIFAVLLIIGLAFLPTLWVRGVLAQHSADRSDFPGTGGEFARHLLDEMGLGAGKVEETAVGDHYDPALKAVRLTPDISRPLADGDRRRRARGRPRHAGRHRLQAAESRTRLAKTARFVEPAGGVVMLAAPLAAVLIRPPGGFVLEFAAGLLILSLRVILHLTTLPVEFDASFGRALPLLKAGRYIPDRDFPAARSILRAAAFTYVAAAL